MLSKEWKAAAEILQALLDKWKSNLLRFQISSSIEDIAKERMKWCYMVAGIETMLLDFDECIKMFEESEVKRRELINQQGEENE